MASGLPIKIVVLTIVGMAGLSAMLVFINESSGMIPRPMHAEIKGTNLIILSKSDDLIEIPIEVICSNDGTPVERANVDIFGLDFIGINTTDRNGRTIIRLNINDLELDVNEGYLKLNVKANGFRDYTNEYAIKVVK